MKITRKDLSGSQVELKIELDSEDIKPHLIESAKHISQHLNIAGFRPGKAPYDMVKREVGENKIFTEAVDDMLNSSLLQAMRDEKIYPYTDPELKVDKMVPLQELNFTVTMDIYPQVTLGVWPTDKVKKQEIKVSKEEVESGVKELTKMLMNEEVVERPAEKGDKTLVDFDVLVDGVPIEGGSAKDYAVVIGEGKMIPGFEDKIVGLKAGETADFKLNFPKDYKQDLAGKEAEFKITLKQVLKLTEPEMNDELAKRLGVSSKDELYQKLEENLKNEKSQKDAQRAEIEAVKKVVDAATITELPKKMIHDEVHRLVHEFEHDLAQQGIDLQTYLGNVGKKVGDLEKEFEPRAIERLKTSIVVEEVAEQEKLEVDEKEIDAEWNKQKQFYNNQPDVLKQVNDPSYRNHLKIRMLRVKAVGLITSKLVE
jgi:trigger factor